MSGLFTRSPSNVAAPKPQCVFAFCARVAQRVRGCARYPPNVYRVIEWGAAMNLRKDGRQRRLLVRASFILLPFSLAGSAFLFGQMDARTILERSISVADRSWAAKRTYTFIERDQETHLDSEGQVKSTDVEVDRAIIVNGDTFEQTISHNGQPPTAEKKKKEQELLRKRQNETPAQREARLKEEDDDRGFIKEVPDAFSFRLLSDEVVEGRPAYVLDALPKPDYQAKTKYGKMFSKVHGKLWVDKEDFGWVKVEANVLAPFSMFFLARVQPGTRINFEQTRVGDGIWLPRRVDVKAEAKILFVKNYQLDESITYSNYQPTAPTKKY